MGEYKCDNCGREFKSQWRLTNHECTGVKKIDLSGSQACSIVEIKPLVRPPVPARPIQSVPEPNPVLEIPVPLNPQKHSRDWGAEIKAQKPKRLHKYL
jgi:hypothetical protein